MKGIVADSSAILGILQEEPEKEEFLKKIEDAERSSLSAASYLESAIVVDSPRNPLASHSLDALLRTLRIQIEALTPEQAEIARQAYRDFGRGMHPAGLNFGDCFSYALAMERMEPLLFKGNDFSQTDVLVAQ